MAKLPLEGIRILDMCVVWAGPYGTMLLADMGAEVIKVETTQVFPMNTRGVMARTTREREARFAQGESWYPHRNPGQRPWNRVAQFVPFFRNKYAMTVDLRQPEGKDIFRRLVEKSDGLVENNAPGSMGRLGFTYDVLSQWNPRFVMISSAGFGQTGPMSGFRGFGTDFGSVTGQFSLGGYADMGPDGAAENIAADYAAAVGTAFAFVMALHNRNRTGKGVYIDISQAENHLHQVGEFFLDYFANGRVGHAMSNRDPVLVQGVYPSMGNEAWIAISIATDAQWRALCDLMGRPELAEDERFADAVSRHQNHDAVDEIMAAWTKENDPVLLFYQLQQAGIAAGPVQHEDDIYRCPQLYERRFWATQTPPEVGTYLSPGTIYKSSKMPLTIRKPLVRLGEDNEYVYKQVLGVSDKEYADLEANGHIGMDYDPSLNLPGAVPLR